MKSEIQNLESEKIKNYFPPTGGVGGMRLLKLAVISLIVIFLLLTGIGLLLPSSVVVTRSVYINASADSVRFYTNNISHWKYWLNNIETNQNDSSITKNATIKSGAYTVSVLKNNPENIITLWHGKNIKDRICHIQLDNSEPNVTTVYMSFEQHLSWLPWDRLGGMLHDEIIGPSIQASLDKLKQVIEKN